jgi:probable rRNA maturation factor
LNHRYSTDVISFNSSFLNKIVGEIFLSIPTILKNSITYSKGNFENELNRVMAHGLLHLIGYDDKIHEDILRMRKKEDHYLNFLA